MEGTQRTGNEQRAVNLDLKNLISRRLIGSMIARGRLVGTALKIKDPTLGGVIVMATVASGSLALGIGGFMSFMIHSNNYNKIERARVQQEVETERARIQALPDAPKQVTVTIDPAELACQFKRAGKVVSVSAGEAVPWKDPSTGQELKVTCPGPAR